LIENKEKAKIELIMNYPCKSLQELQMKEREITETFVEDKNLIVLNTIFNRKKQIKNSEVKIQRLEKVNVKEQIKVIDYIENKVLRYRNPETGIDIKMSYNKTGKEETMKKLYEKIEEKMKVINPEFTIEF